MAICEETEKTRVKPVETAGEEDKMRLRRIQCDSRSEREYTHFLGVGSGRVAVSVGERKYALKISLFFFQIEQDVTLWRYHCTMRYSYDEYLIVSLNETFIYEA